MTVKFPNHRISLPLALAALLLAALPHAARPATADADTITVFAAASTSNAIGEITDTWTASGNGHVHTVFASSGMLARQIANGAPADLFLSANTRWMDWLAERGFLAGKAVPLFGNTLVLIQPAGAAETFGLDAGLADRLAEERLAIGDPDHVPAGIYARAALQSMRLWPALEPRIVRMQNVRAALLMVARGEAAAGIVYASDAQISKSVRVVATIPEGNTPPIVYPAAIIRDGNRAAAEKFLDHLRGAESRAVFRRHGFAAP